MPPQAAVSLDSCRAMALRSNKQLMISRERMNTAHYQNKEAFAAYLPAIDFTGGYAYNQRQIALLGEDAMLPTKTFDLATQSYQYNIVKNPVTGEPVLN
ncbi:MAG: TolC family protein, partial [Muribaculaceae bacterium]|nr:TolC family protein [Muribaculaceae bacterium]